MVSKSPKADTMNTTKIDHIKGFIASDHGGVQLKDCLKNKFPLIDLGPFSEDAVDYPDYAKKVCRMVVKEKSLGILICRSGIGMSMAANKCKGIRAALCRSVHDAETSRQHNHANVLVLGADVTSAKEALKIAEKFFATPYDMDPRHVRRVKKIE